MDPSYFNVTLASTLFDLEQEASDRHRQYGQKSPFLKRNRDGRGKVRALDRRDPSYVEQRVRTGIKEVDKGLPFGLWSDDGGYGKIIGIGSVDADDDEDDGGNNGVGQGRDNTHSHELMANILCTHILDNFHYRDHDRQAQERSSSRSRPSSPLPPTSTVPLLSHSPLVYLLAPPNSTLITSIYNTLVARLQASSTSSKISSTSKQDPVNIQTATTTSAAASLSVEDQALGLLDTITVLPYLDLIGLTESISEVSSSLFSRHSSPSPIAATHTTTTMTTSEETSHQTQRLEPNSTIISIEGLPQTVNLAVTRSLNSSNFNTSSTAASTNTSSTSSSSNVLTTAITPHAALLSNLLRNLRGLCRNTRSISVESNYHNVEDIQGQRQVNTQTPSPLPPPPPPTILIDLHVTLTHKTSISTSNSSNSNSNSIISENDHSHILHSAFAHPQGRLLSLTLSPFSSSSSSLSSTMAMGTAMTTVKKSRTLNQERTNTLFSRILKDVTDSIVVVHDGFRRREDTHDEGGREKEKGERTRIIEVVSDNNNNGAAEGECEGQGGNVGVWTVWDVLHNHT